MLDSWTMRTKEIQKWLGQNLFNRDPWHIKGVNYSRKDFIFVQKISWLYSMNKRKSNYHSCCIIVHWFYYAYFMSTVDFIPTLDNFFFMKLQIISKHELYCRDDFNTAATLHNFDLDFQMQILSPCWSELDFWNL